MGNSSANVKKLFIVVIDDSEVVCRILKTVLTEEGHQVTSFLDPVAALRSILKTGETPLPDLLFIDISMPSLSGYETARGFKNHQASTHIPIIIISRLDDTIARLKARLVGAVAFLPKPFEAWDVLTLVQSFASPPNPPKN